MGKKRSKEQFIIKSNKTHENFYSYDKFIYNGSTVKGTITCPLHGDFEQTPVNHIRGQKCSLCSGKRLNLSKFLEKSFKVHGKKYNYDKSLFTYSLDNIIITCPDHGDFHQRAANHLRGDGCSKCKGNHKSTKDEFIELASKVHGIIYDYTEVKYVNRKSKVIIICPYHGPFSQTPNGHLSGRGCKQCNMQGGYSYSAFRNKPELKNKNGLLYIIKINDKGYIYYKIGITTKTVYKRFNHKSYTDIQYEVILEIKDNLYKLFCLEQNILKQKISKLVQPNPMPSFGGASECFLADEKEMAELRDFLNSAFLEERS